MTSTPKLVLSGVLVIILLTSLSIYPLRHRGPQPQIAIKFLGYVHGTGSAAFNISNPSPYAIQYSGAYRIQRPSLGGWITLTQNLLSAGGNLLPGRSEDVQVVVPHGQPEWRVEFDVMRGATTWRNSLWYETARVGLQRLGLPLLEPREYGRSSDTVRQ
jgi:hypothetical protein